VKGLKAQVSTMKTMGTMNKEEKSRKRKTKLKKFVNSWQLYAFVSLAFLTIFIFSYIPMYGIVIAFKDFRPAMGIWGSPWVGFDHFIRFFESHHFWTLIKNTLAINIYALVVGFPLPIILALAFNEVKDSFFKKFTQTVTYAPHFISVVVLSGMVVSFLSPTTGVINHFLEFLGFQRIAFLSEPDWFRSIYVLSGVWQSTGWASIIYLAALAGVDPTLHEAAIVDGATRLQRVWYINLPAIMPTVMILLIMNVGSLMAMGFERIFLLQNPLNLATSNVIATYVYEMGLLNAQFSFAAAIGLFNAAINAVLLIMVNRISSKVSEVSLW